LDLKLYNNFDIKILDFVQVLWFEEPQIHITQGVSWISITESDQFLSIWKISTICDVSCFCHFITIQGNKQIRFISSHFGN